MPSDARPREQPSRTKRASLFALWLALVVLSIGSVIALAMSLSLDVSASRLGALIIQIALLFWWTQKISQARRVLWYDPSSDPYGVPHVQQFQRTEDGFIVGFSRTPMWLNRMADASGASGGAAILMLPVLLIGLAIQAILRLRGGTTITVTPDNVVIDGKALSRSTFGSFHLGGTWQINGLRIAVLGYTFGNKSFSFGGSWPEHEAYEVAAALNRHLKQTPTVRGEQRASTEQLRSTRPTDF